MPRAGDAFLNGQLPASNNPLIRITVDPSKPAFDVAAFIKQWTTFVETYLFPIIKNLTGIDLTTLAPVLKSLTDFVSSISSVFSGNPLTFFTTLVNLFGGAGGLGQAGNFFTNLLSLFGNPLGLLGATGTFNPAGALGGAGSIPILGPLIQQFITLLAGSGSGLTGLSGLTSVFTDLLGLFGSPTGLGGGSPVLPGVGSIPILGPIFSLFGGATSSTQALNFFTNLLSLLGGPTLTGSTGAFNVTTVATNFINTVLNPTGLLASVTAIVNAITGSAGTLTNLTSWFTDLTGLLGSPLGLGTGSASTSIPFGNVAGIQGIVDIGTAAQNTWNSLTTAFGGSTAATNEAQQINVGGSPTGGTFTLSYGGNTTSALAYNASASTIQTALTGLASIGAGNLVASGGPLMTAPVTVTFQGALADTPTALLGHTDSLTGGPGPQPAAVAINETTRGGPSVTLSNLTTLAQQQTLNASNAIGLAGTNNSIINFRKNRPGSNGLLSTMESTFPISHILAGSAPPTSVAVTSSNAAMGLVRSLGADSKGLVQWLGSGSSSITGFYVNVYTMDLATGNLTLQHTSPDMHTSLTSGWSWLTYTFSGPNQTPVNAGDILAAEFVVVGAGTHNVAGLASTWLPTHPTSMMKSIGAARNPVTLGNSPASITAGSIGWSGTTPWLGVGITNVPANYQPPTTTQYTTAGTYTYTIPTWARIAGTFLDLIEIGGGGAGQGEQGYNLGQGGYAGTWAAQTLTCGTDYPVGATSVTVVVGAGGPQQITYFADGNPGSNSTVTWNDGTTNHTLTATGGAGGHGAGIGYRGQGAGNEIFNSVTYYGGTSVSTGSTGSSPGGGGGGAPPYLFGGAGATGSVWIVARQS